MTQALKNNNAPAKTAITPTRAQNFPEWYQEVVRAADLAENAPVKGCMTIKPYGYALWENVQRALDDKIKAEEVQNAYFPLLIPLSFIAREAAHIDGFAKECAVVTHHRLEVDAMGVLGPAAGAKLEEPYIIRPTSETIIGDAMARWIQSYRDLPLKLNQWCNVMRWELRTRLFLRTTEFLWQEGHNAFATADEADQDARRMLEVYRSLYRDVLAIAGIAGEKTTDERFPGADRSYTIEAMMQDGKALQACTSHNLGQHFSKSFDITYQGADKQVHHCWTTSWGLSTRSIGGVVMSHGDDDGMVMPPRIAPQQIVILPVIRDDTQTGTIMEYGTKIRDALKARGIRAMLDARDLRTPDKMWEAIKKGIPLRIEIGGRECADGTLTHIRRDLGKESKETCSVDHFIGKAQEILDAMHHQLLSRNEHLTREGTCDVTSLSQLRDCFAADHKGFARVPVAVINDTAWGAVKKEFALSCRCLPFENDGQHVIIARSY